MKKEHAYIIAGIVTVIAFLIIKRQSIMNTVNKVTQILTRSEFINKFADTVKKASYGTGLFPSLFMAQAILESADSKGNPGNSGLARNHNNFFGIKADKSWTGAKAILKTREVIDGKEVYVDEPFRKYKTPFDSFVDRVLFLQKNKRYANNGVFSAKTPEAQAEALQRAGYATDPNYSKMLISLINKHGLKSLD